MAMQAQNFKNLEKKYTCTWSLPRPVQNIKNLEENSPVLGACPGQSGTHETELSPGDDGDDGGEEQDTGNTGQQVKEHLGIKFMYIRGRMIESHP